MKKAKVLLFLLISSIWIGCGRNSENETKNSLNDIDIENANDIYVAETENFISTDYIVGICSTSEKMYIATSEEAKSEVHVIDLTTRENTCLSMPLEKGKTSLIKGISLNANENLVIIEQYTEEIDSGQKDSIIIKTCAPSNGEIISSVDITSQILCNRTSFINGFIIDKDNNYYLFIDRTIQVFSPKGLLLFECNPSVKWFSDVCLTKEGEVAFLATSESEDGPVIGIIDVEKKSVDRIYNKVVANIGNGVLVQGFEQDLLISSGDIVSSFSLEKGEQKQLFSWMDSKIAGEQICFLKDLGNGSLVAVMTEPIGTKYQTQIIYLTQTMRSEIPQKETLVLATYLSSPELIEKVNYFNQKNQKYQVEIKAYCKESDSYEEQKQAYTDMMLDILTGKGADIVEGYYFNAEFWASHGMIEDLYPYLQMDEDLKNVEFFQSVLDGNTVDEMLVCIPSSFCIETMAADIRVVEERQGMTIDELMVLMEEYSGKQPPFTDTSEEIINRIFKNCINEFVNWEEGNCFFESEDFYEILEFAKKYGYSTELYGVDIEIGSQIFVKQYLNSIAKYKAENLYANDNLYGGDGYGWVGYPISGADTTNGARLDNGQTFWMSAQSEKKEGAWEFIKIFLMPEYYEKQIEKDILSMDFPSRKDMYNLVCDEWMTTDIIEDENGKEMEVSKNSYYGGLIGTSYNVPITEDDKKEITEMIEGMGKMSVLDHEIKSIIAEEAEAFFQGVKSVEEVSEIIQNRVQLYIDEKQ